MEAHAMAALAGDDQHKIKALYLEYRVPFMNFGKRYGASPELLEDVYQEAFLALRKKAISGKLVAVNSKMKTYLFGIGKFMIFDRLKEEKKNISYDAKLHIAEAEIDPIAVEAPEPLNEQQRLLRNYFKELGEKCRQVLTFFYYRGLSIKEIVLKAGYKDENNVKATKSRCLKMLREKITSHTYG